MSYPYSAENRLETTARYQYAPVSLDGLRSYFEAREIVLTALGTVEDAGPLAAVAGRLLQGTDTAAQLLQALKPEGTLETAVVLDALLSWGLAGGNAVGGDVWLDRTIQRFEVSKKLYVRYLPGFRKGDGEFTEIGLYQTFALLLCLRIEQTGSVRLLSTLMKVTDLLCSLPVGMLAADQVSLIVRSELKAVRQLMSTKGLSLVS